MSPDVIKLSGRVNFTNVPSDQQKLLDRYGIGAVPSQAHCPSLDDVPSHVLPGVIEALMERRKRGATALQPEDDRHPVESLRSGAQQLEGTAERGTSPCAAAPQQKETNSRPSGATHQQIVFDKQTLPSQPTPPRASNTADLRSSPSIPMTWTPSSRGWEDDERDETDVVEAETPSKQTSGTSKPDITTHTVEPELCPPEVAAPRPPPRPVPAFDFPSSAPEEDLEVELPHAQGRPVLSMQDSVSKTTVPESSIRTPGIRKPTTMDTPPCAQPSQQVIPATVEPDSAPEQQPAPLEHDMPQGNRPKRMKLMKLSEPWATNAALPSVKVTTAAPRMASTKSYPALESSNTTHSSSVVEASQQPENTDRRESTSGLAQLSSAETLEPTNQESPLKMTEDISQEDRKPPEEERRRRSIDSPRSQSEASFLRDRPCFEAFVLAYPEYTSEYGGSLGSFVKACLCLEQMANHRSLHQYLWDDFIRVCSAEYLKSAQHTINPLVASNLYHDTVKFPRFRSSVVQDETLQHILSQYPDEMAKAGEHVAIASSDGGVGPQVPSVTGSSSPMPNDANRNQRPQPQPLPKRKRDNPITQHGVSKPRAVSNPFTLPKHGEIGKKIAKAGMSKKLGSEEGARSRHSLGSLPVNANTNTPRAADSYAIARQSTPASSVASTPGSIAAYIKKARGRKLTSDKYENRWRELLQQPSREKSSG